MSSMNPQPIDLRNWILETYIFDPRYPATNWVRTGSTVVEQTANGNPAFFCSPDLDAFNTAFEGKISVQQTDNNDVIGDFIGFAIGFNPGQNGQEDGDSKNLNADYLLLDWKQGDQQYDYDGCPSGELIAKGGLALSRVRGIPANAEMWYHSDLINCNTSQGGVEELARGQRRGSVGWQNFVEYDFKFEYTPSEIKVFVNDELEIFLTASASNPFPSGSFCFYNYSVAKVRYQGFTEQMVTSAPSTSPSTAPSSEPTISNAPTISSAPTPTMIEPTDKPVPQPTKKPTAPTPTAPTPTAPTPTAPTPTPPTGPLCPSKDNCNWFGFRGFSLHKDLFGICGSKCIWTPFVQLFIGLLGYECDSEADKSSCSIDLNP